MRQTGKIVINEIAKNQKGKPNAQLNKKTLTKCQIFEYILITINRLLIGFVTLYMCWMCLRLKYKEIPFHALLCTIAFVCLMSEGLMAYYRANAWTLLCIRPEKTKIHWSLQLLASILGLIGIAIKIDLEDKHFYTVHGLLGLLTAVILILNLLSGLSSLYAHELEHYLQPLISKAFHNIGGLLTFTMAMISMYTAFDTDIFFEYSLLAANFNDFKWLMQVFIIIIWLLSIYGPLWCLFYTKLCRSF